MVQHKKFRFRRAKLIFWCYQRAIDGDFLDGYRVDLRAALTFLFSNSIIISPCSLGLMETGMGELVNLRRFKKRAEKQQSAQQADANRARFGRSKSERIV